VLRRVNKDFGQAHIIQIGQLLLDADRHEVQLAGKPIELTPTEFDLLKTLMEYPGHAFTRQSLIEQGLGFNYEGMERTLDSHIRNLRRKIEPDPAEPSYIRTVFGVGYRMQGPEST
jgi:two-component system alkaline phosphatase synthesis response regulator PhoP